MNKDDYIFTDTQKQVIELLEKEDRLLANEVARLFVTTAKLIEKTHTELELVGLSLRTIEKEGE